MKYIILITTLMMAAVFLTGSVCLASQVPEENETAAYTVCRINGEPDEPGEPGAPDWDTIPTLYIDHIQWKPDYGVWAQGQLCYDDEFLYIHLMATEQDIRAEYTEPLSPVNEDSCLEFFFMPEGGDRYFNFEINPNGCLHFGIGHDRYDRVFLHRDDYADYFHITTDRTPDGWEVYYVIPLEFLNVFYPDYQFEGALLANFYKCGDKTEHKHYLTWNTVRSEKPDYHRPEDFGRLEFAQ